MKVCGSNSLFQLGEESNNKNPNDSPIISPPCDSHIDVSSLLSFSTYWDNSIWVQQNGCAYSVGSNCYGQISVLLPKKTLLKDTEIEITGRNGKPCKFLSAVCGEYYTLYHAYDERRPNDTYLVYTYRYKIPLFLNISGRIPKALFGGRETAAVIDSEGAIIIITKAVLTSFKNSIEPCFLPENEKAVKVACCDEFVLALGSSGRLFEYSLINPGQKKFMEINELKGQRFVDVSGSFVHCLAVRKDGRVFGRGPNDCCQLGFRKDKQNIPRFTLVHSLKSFEITNVFAGCAHSLFLTKNGRLITCGKNYYGELFLNEGPSREYVYPPSEIVNYTASFCIAGCCTSVIFVDSEIPQNCPNKIVRDFLKSGNLIEKVDIEKVEISEEDTITEVFDITKSVNEEEEGEINSSEVNSSEIIKIEIENEKLKIELENAKKEIENLQQKEKENEILKHELAIAKKEIAKLNQKK